MATTLTFTTKVSAHVHQGCPFNTRTEPSLAGLFSDILSMVAPLIYHFGTKIQALPSNNSCYTDFMDTEEKEANMVKWTAEKIWANFLHCGDGKTWFDVDENIELPTPKEQKRDVHKFQFRGGLKILKENGNHFEILVFKEKFKKILSQFRNPRMAFDSYRTSGISQIELPEETKWENIKIKFLTGNDIKITLTNNPGFRKKFNYKEMGFENSRTTMPNKQWQLLERFAESEGTIDWQNRFATKELKKQKELLSKTLKAQFSIDEDPFYSYRKEKCYRAKFALRLE